MDDAADPLAGAGAGMGPTSGPDREDVWEVRVPAMPRATVRFQEPVPPASGTQASRRRTASPAAAFLPPTAASARATTASVARQQQQPQQQDGGASRIQDRLSLQRAAVPVEAAGSPAGGAGGSIQPVTEVVEVSDDDRQVPALSLSESVAYLKLLTTLSPASATGILSYPYSLAHWRDTVSACKPLVGQLQMSSDAFVAPPSRVPNGVEWQAIKLATSMHTAVMAAAAPLPTSSSASTPAPAPASASDVLALGPASDDLAIVPKSKMPIASIVFGASSEGDARCRYDPYTPVDRSCLLLGYLLRSKDLRAVSDQQCMEAWRASLPLARELRLPAVKLLLSTGRLQDVAALQEYGSPNSVATLFVGLNELTRIADTAFKDNPYSAMASTLCDTDLLRSWLEQGRALARAAGLASSAVDPYLFASVQARLQSALMMWESTMVANLNRAYESNMPLLAAARCASPAISTVQSNAIPCPTVPDIPISHFLTSTVPQPPANFPELSVPAPAPAATAASGTRQRRGRAGRSSSGSGAGGPTPPSVGPASTPTLTPFVPGSPAPAWLTEYRSSSDPAIVSAKERVEWAALPPELLTKFTSLTVGGRPVCGKYLAFGPAGCKTRACRFAHIDSSNNVVTQH